MVKDEGLAHLIGEGIIDAVHARLMSGKEATVYVVEREGHYGAAKVYKTRDERTFKKTASYTEGRNQTRNTRDRRAMQNRSSYGRGLIEESWQDMEFAALRAAFDAGVRVPEPYFMYENVLFMELIVDEHGVPAARLADFSFTPDVAASLHLEIFLQVKRLLGIGRIHGDLSAYNVLMAGKGPTLIDMPQVVDVSGNNNARMILRRDLRNVTEHLARFDARLLRYVDCGEALFRHFAQGSLGVVLGPEVGLPNARGGGGGSGRRGRDAERGRAGRDKGQRPGVAAPASGGGKPPTLATSTAATTAAARAGAARAGGGPPSPSPAGATGSGRTGGATSHVNARTAGAAGAPGARMGGGPSPGSADRPSGAMAAGPRRRRRGRR